MELRANLRVQCDRGSPCGVSWNAREEVGGTLTTLHSGVQGQERRTPLRVGGRHSFASVVRIPASLTPFSPPNPLSPQKLYARPGSGGASKPARSTRRSSGNAFGRHGGRSADAGRPRTDVCGRGFGTAGGKLWEGERVSQAELTFVVQGTSSASGSGSRTSSSQPPILPFGSPQTLDQILSILPTRVEVSFSVPHQLN